MRQTAPIAIFSILLSAAIGCSSSKNNQPVGSSDAGDSCPSFSTNSAGDMKVTAATANNYTFWSQITFDAATSVASRTTLTFDWHAVTTDFLKQPMDPKSG